MSKNRSSERKPTEKEKPISYLPKTYKRARKKQQEENIGEESMALTSSESDLDAHQSSFLDPITTACTNGAKSVSKDQRDPSQSYTE